MLMRGGHGMVIDTVKPWSDRYHFKGTVINAVLPELRLAASAAQIKGLKV
jgi:hypothetical protein